VGDDWLTGAENGCLADVEVHDPEWDGVEDPASAAPDNGVPAEPELPTLFRPRLYLIE
jgi:hypothetical protein